MLLEAKTFPLAFFFFLEVNERNCVWHTVQHYDRDSDRTGSLGIVGARYHQSFIIKRFEVHTSCGGSWPHFLLPRSPVIKMKRSSP